METLPESVMNKLFTHFSAQLRKKYRGHRDEFQTLVFPYTTDHTSFGNKGGYEFSVRRRRRPDVGTEGFIIPLPDNHYLVCNIIERALPRGAWHIQLDSLPDIIVRAARKRVDIITINHPEYESLHDIVATLLMLETLL